MRQVVAGLGAGSLAVAFLAAASGCGTSGASAGAVRAEPDPRLTRVVLVNADGTSTDLGDR